jgi:Uma2 family endonuclease
MAVRAANAPPAKRLFSVTEYHRFGEAGILSEDDRVELIKGEVVEMSPIGSRHAACVRALQELVQEKLGRTAQVSVQNPIQLDEHSEPQTDVALVTPRKDRYANAHPRPADVLLVIEVADTSIEFDQSVKLPLYARAKIPEAWLVDLNQ